MTDRIHGVLPPEAFDAMSGLDALLAMMRSALPEPTIAKLLNFTLLEAKEGYVLFEGTPDGLHLNPAGTVHGGWTAAVMDSAMGCAVHSTLQPGERFTTVEMKVSYLRPILAGKTGPMRCEGFILNRGRTLALSEAKLFGADGRLYAHATETCMIFPKNGGKA